MKHKDGGIKNFPTAPLQGRRNLPPACRLCIFSPSPHLQMLVRLFQRSGVVLERSKCEACPAWGGGGVGTAW